MIYVVIGNHARIAGEAAENSPYHHPYDGDLVTPRYEDRVVKKLKRTDGPLKYEFGTLKMMLFSAELSV